MLEPLVYELLTFLVFVFYEFLDFFLEFVLKLAS